MTCTHILGFPRIGARRELKFALEKHWRGEIDASALEATGADLRARHWQAQRGAGLDFVTVGDFAYYDHVANHIQLLGCEPARFGFEAGAAELSRYFTMARGVAAQAGQAHGTHGAHCVHSAEGTRALEMTKWFDTNYHYLVPEFDAATQFHLNSTRLFDEVAQALALGHPVKAVLLGPLSFLWLGKEKQAGRDRFTRLEALLPVYGQVLARLKAQGVAWVQMDEPVLGLDLPDVWRHAFERAYWQLARSAPRLMLATYFSPLAENLRMACQLPVAGLHVDAVRAAEELPGVVDWLPAHKVLSVGIVDGRNIWRNDLDAALERLRTVRDKHQGELWIAPSCSLLHVPSSLDAEPQLDAEIKSWLACASEKLDELRVLRAALDTGAASVQAELRAARAALAARRASPRVNRADVALRVARTARGDDQRRSPFARRQAVQRARHALPALPTTTIPSFPPTPHTPPPPPPPATPGHPCRARGLQTRRPGHRQLPREDARGHRLGRSQAGRTGHRRIGARRSRAQRHGRVLRRATRWLRVHGQRLGSVLRLTLRQAAGDLRRRGAAGTDDARMDELRPKPDPTADEGHVDRPEHPSPMVLRARRPAAQRDGRADCLGHARRGAGPGSGRHRHHPDRRAGPARGPAAAPLGLEDLPGRSGPRLPDQRQRGRRPDADSHAHVLLRVQRHPARDRRAGCRRDHHRNQPLGHGTAARLRGFQIPQRDRAGHLRHPFAARARHRRDAAADAQGGCGNTGSEPLDQP